MQTSIMDICKIDVLYPREKVPLVIESQYLTYKEDLLI